MARVEEFINLKAGQAESFAIVDPSYLADHILEIKDPYTTVTLFNKIYFKILDAQQNKNKLGQARIDHFAHYMDRYIPKESVQDGNHLEHFLSRFNLLVTDTIPEGRIEVNSDSFNSQLNELETVYNLDINKQINEDDELKNNLGRFIYDAVDEKIEVYTDRIEAVLKRIPLPLINSDVPQ